MKSKIRCSYTKLLAGNVHTIQSSPFTRLLNRFFSYFLFFFSFLFLWQDRFSLEIWDDGWVNRAATCLVRFVSLIAIQTSGYMRWLCQRLCGVTVFSFLIFLHLCIVILTRKKKRKDWDWIVKKKGWNIFETWDFLLQILFHYINGNYFK